MRFATGRLVVVVWRTASLCRSGRRPDRGMTAHDRQVASWTILSMRFPLVLGSDPEPTMRRPTFAAVAARLASIYLASDDS